MMDLRDHQRGLSWVIAVISKLHRVYRGDYKRTISRRSVNFLFKLPALITPSPRLD
jgi:hypothetical protein